jgi:hypothetical protein
MGQWKEMLLNGQGAALNSLTLTAPLTASDGGTGTKSFVVGSILTGSIDSNNIPSLLKFGIGGEGTVLKVTNQSNGVFSWATDDGSGINSVDASAVAGQSSMIQVADTTTTPTVSMLTVAGGSTPTNSQFNTGALATGTQIDHFLSQNYTNNTGTVTGVTVVDTSAPDSLTLALGGTPAAPIVTLGGSIDNLDKDNMANSANGFTLGTTKIQLGDTSTSLAGVTGISFTGATTDRLIGNSGAWAFTLSIADSNTEVEIPGNLRVDGVAQFINSTNLAATDPIAVLASGSQNSDGGLLIENAAPQVGNIKGHFFGFKYGTGSTGRWGFSHDTTEAGIVGGTTSPNGSVDRPWIPTVERDTEGQAPSAAPAYGGSTNGYGNMYVGASAAYIYMP